MEKEELLPIERQRRVEFKKPCRVITTEEGEVLITVPDVLTFAVKNVRPSANRN